MVEYSSLLIRQRVQARGISDADIQFCLDNSDLRYPHRGATVYRARLPDSRNIKVFVSTTHPYPITHAFTYL